MSQEIINHITRLTRAIEALAVRVTAIEQRPAPTIDEQTEAMLDRMPPVKRGPGRPRKDASGNAP